MKWILHLNYEQSDNLYPQILKDMEYKITSLIESIFVVNLSSRSNTLWWKKSKWKHLNLSRRKETVSSIGGAADFMDDGFFCTSFPIGRY